MEILTENKILPGNPRLSAIIFINIWAEYMAEQYYLSKGFRKDNIICKKTAANKLQQVTRFVIMTKAQQFKDSQFPFHISIDGMCQTMYSNPKIELRDPAQQFSEWFSPFQFH